MSVELLVAVMFAAVPVVFWLNVGQVNVPVLKSPEVGVPRAGVTNVGDVDKTTEPVPVDVVTPVPPLATAKVPESVKVPLDVIGPPVNDIPVVPPEASTKVTVPEAALVQEVSVPLVVKTLPLLPA